jgi:glutamine amidotransferase
MIALLNYGSGNLRSVYNALLSRRADVRIFADPRGIEEASGIILPGVGAFGDCVEQIRQRGFWEPVQRWIAADQPFLGICVGYQVLFEGSEEAPSVPGMGVFPGRVRKFTTPGLKVPQIGWNSLHLTRPEDPLWEGLPPAPHVYFVHSYYPETPDAAIVAATATYGETFAAAAGRGRVCGVQFHPEKSQAVGLRILENFVRNCASGVA